MNNVNKLKCQKGLARRHRRVRGKVFGTAERPRLCVNRSNKHIYAQVIDDVTHTTICGASSLGADFKATGAKASTVDGANKLGEIIAKLAQDKGVTTVVFDRGGNLYHGRVKALAEGARAAGLVF